jgi:hypothetical protein
VYGYMLRGVWVNNRPQDMNGADSRWNGVYCFHVLEERGNVMILTYFYVSTHLYRYPVMKDMILTIFHPRNRTKRCWIKVNPPSSQLQLEAVAKKLLCAAAQERQLGVQTTSRPSPTQGTAISFANPSQVPGTGTRGHG